MPNKLAIIIPAYNEASVLADTLASIRQIIPQLPLPVEIIVVNDGSRDNTGQVAQDYADVTLSHRRNCGLGAALATGIEYAKRHGFTALITFDADGQHSPRDIVRAYRELARGYDVVIGSRFLGSHEAMPAMRRGILWLSNLVTYLFFGVWTTDSQSGFRALSSTAISSLHLLGNRMEVSSEFFGQIKKLGLKYSEIPIHVHYTRYSLSKGQGNTAGFGVLLKLLYLVGR